MSSENPKVKSMSEVPAVRCSCCFELVSWSDFPDHLNDHGGSMEVDMVVVSGERPQKQAIGKYDTENCVRMVLRDD